MRLPWIIGVNILSLMSQFGNLIYIVGRIFKKAYHLAHVGEVDIDVITVDGHFAKIRDHADNARPLHAVANELPLLFVHAEMKVEVSFANRLFFYARHIVSLAPLKFFTGRGKHSKFSQAAVTDDS